MLILGAFIGFYWSNNDFLICPKDNICSLAGEKLELKGRIVSWPSQRLEKTLLEVELGADNRSLEKSGRLLLVLSHAHYDFEYLEEVNFRGKIKKPEADDKSNFSYPLFLAGRGIFALIQDPEITGRSFEAKPFSLTERFLVVLAEWRERMRDWLGRTVKEPEASVIKAMVLGDQGEIPETVRTPLSRSGLIHILSISGSHVTFLIFVFSAVFARIGISGGLSLMLNLIFIAFYLFLSGAPACAERAGLMGMMALFFTRFGFLPRPALIFWFAFVVLLIQNSLAPVADIGFQLSFLAVFSMLFVFPPLNKILFWGRNGKLVVWGSVLLFGVVVSLFTAPLSVFYFGNLPWIAPVANLILAPLISLLLPWGMIFLAINFLLTWIGISILEPSLILAYPLHWFWQLIILINDYLLKIPFAFEEKEFSPKDLFIFFVLAIGMNSLVRGYLFPKIILARMKKFSHPDYWEKYQKNKISIRSKWKSKIFRPTIIFYQQNKLFVFYFFLMIVVAGFSLLYFQEKNRPASLAFLDVGQGDATLINLPDRSLQILIDGGPGRKIMSELEREMPFFDNKIEFVVLTHYHQDHLEGLLTVLAKYRIGCLVVPYLKSGPPFSLERFFVDQVAKIEDLKIILARNGQSLLFSDLKNNSNKLLELKILSPLIDFSEHKILDANDESVVIKLIKPKEILLMGDATIRTEKLLREKMPTEIEAEILKVGHHGSRFSSGEDFLRAVNPRSAVVSVGKKNMYGHPTKQALERMAKQSIEVRRTDLLGTVKLRL